MTADTVGRRSHFQLTKWYLDCVAPDGRVVIAYWTSLRWRSIGVRWHSVTMYEPGRPPARRSSRQRVASPVLSGDTLLWSAPALTCEVRGTRQQPAIDTRLLDTDGGVVDWCVEAPITKASVTLAGYAPLHGQGYVERIAITIPPWHLPIRELRWGRWINQSADTSLVWIDWRGVVLRSWAFVNAVPAGATAISDDYVRAGDITLTLDRGRVLDDWAFADIAAMIPPVRHVVPASFLGLRQTRWCSGGVMSGEHKTLEAGDVIHELVLFP